MTHAAGSDADSVARFTGLGTLYAQFRPDYPAAAVDFIVEHCRLTAGSAVVDVGCGTGISSRLLARRGLHVVGVEPNADMRRQAEQAGAAEACPAIVYREAHAENTGLPDARADAVLAAQSFHWFDAARALAEFRRLLRPGGWAILMWNERDESDAFTAAYGDVLRSTPEGPALENKRFRAGQALLDSHLFVERALRTFTHEQTMNEEQMIGRALSVSYAPKAPADVERHVARLQELFRRRQGDGLVTLRYRTSLYVGQRPATELA